MADASTEVSAQSIGSACKRRSTTRKRPGPILMTGYQTPAAIRRVGVKRLTDWLARRSIREAAGFAGRVVEAADAQHTVLPGEVLAARLVRELACRITELDERIKGNDREISALFRTDERAAIIESVPDMGPLLGVELHAATRKRTGPSVCRPDRASPLAPPVANGCRLAPVC
ncbi:hypothetical protein M2164_000358 [Streptomyces sp. SAI-208]|nr:hypothetical protein [Streptomyces sp. SAI-208]